MGDLRNKAWKQERDAQVKALPARLEQRRPPAQSPRCQCGKTWSEVTTMWAHQAGRWAPVKLYCRACLPAKLR